MDYRLNPIVQRLAEAGGSESIVFRTAGGRLNRELANYIKAKKPSSISWVPHEDCGALKFALQQINGQSIWPTSPITKQTAGILRTALRSSGGGAGKDIPLEDFTKILVREGNARLAVEFTGIKFKTEFTCLEEMKGHSDKESMLVVSENVGLRPAQLSDYAEAFMKAKRGSGFKIEEVKLYIIQVPNAALASHDRCLAAEVLGIREIIPVLRGTPAQPRTHHIRS